MGVFDGGAGGAAAPPDQGRSTFSGQKYIHLRKGIRTIFYKYLLYFDDNIFLINIKVPFIYNSFKLKLIIGMPNNIP